MTAFRQLSNRCFLCACEEENVNHILIHCTVARVLWDLVGVQWVFPKTVKGVLYSWGGGGFCGEKKKKVLELHSVIYFLDGLEGNE